MKSTPVTSVLVRVWNVMQTHLNQCSSMCTPAAPADESRKVDRGQGMDFFFFLFGISECGEKRNAYACICAGTGAGLFLKVQRFPLNFLWTGLDAEWIRVFGDSGYRQGFCLFVVPESAISDMVGYSKPGLHNFLLLLETVNFFWPEFNCLYYCNSWNDHSFTWANVGGGAVELQSSGVK